jgi:hypothetical protein
MDRIREPAHCPAVIKMEMRTQNIPHTIGINFQSLKFVHASLLRLHCRKVNVDGGTPSFSRIVCHFDRVPAINDHIPFGMLNQKPGNRYFTRFIETLVHLNVMDLAF